ncbi:hypothetical protein CEXT_382411 [Caerostris extrusa]|uniref:MIF4G domain-containing protein n=1 Tax=Caerostris extrusa TaxID=172846 RepID=A0AAV4PPZ1_CAEEX|nr:hypothetical protein CEXT_382411 [Caerostris extrusa]
MLHPIESKEDESRKLIMVRTTHGERKLKRNVQAVLNKLTFQKFKILLAQLKMLNIDSEEAIGLLVDLIYENSVYEPYFCILYANLCKHLASLPSSPYMCSDNFAFACCLRPPCIDVQVAYRQGAYMHYHDCC